MTAELVLRTPCEHGRSVGLGHCPNDGLSGHDHGGAVECDQWCPGGSELVLDPADIAKAIHDLQDEHGHETRHDIGLALIDALEDS